MIKFFVRKFIIRFMKRVKFSMLGGGMMLRTEQEIKDKIDELEQDLEDGMCYDTTSSMRDALEWVLGGLMNCRERCDMLGEVIDVPAFKESFMKGRCGYCWNNILMTDLREIELRWWEGGWKFGRRQWICESCRGYLKGVFRYAREEGSSINIR